MLSKYLKRTFTVTVIRALDIIGVVLIAFLLLGSHVSFVDRYHISLIVITGMVLSAFIMPLFSVYLSWRVEPLSKMLRRVASSWTLVFAILVIAIFLYKIINNVSRMWLFKWYLCTLAYFILLRLAGYFFLSRMRARGMNTRFIGMLGDRDMIGVITEYLSRHPEMGYQVVGVCFLDGGGDNNKCAGYESFTIKCNESSPDELWIALPMSKAEQIKQILVDMQNCIANIRWLPSTSDGQLLKQAAAEIAGYKIINLAVSPLSDPVNRFIKRVEDIILSISIILIISPVLAAVAIAVKMTSKGPVLFKQERHGIMGRVINVYKFRSMYVHNEEHGHVTQATKHDPRITPVGAFIRRTSIDELPQFFNVLKGDMSVVGPRPHAVAHDDYYKQYIDSYMQRHKVKPGITGWAQVNGWRGETDTMEKMEKRVEFDLYYIDNWSVTFDLKIVFMTVFKGFVNKNAY